MDQHTEGTMDTREIIKGKLRECFDGKIVRKDLTKKIKEGANVPVYVLEFLLGQYCCSDDEEVIEKGVWNVKRILADNFVRPDEAQKILSVLRARGSYTVIDKITVSLNIKRDVYEAEFVNHYCQINNLDGKQPEINKTLMKLMSIKGINLGVTELSQALTIDEVTDIFIRINSQGVVLSQADFAMSKISSDDRYGGNETRKMIDYFCHFMQRPADYDMIVANDKEFAKSEALQKIRWVTKEQEDIYVPSYTDVLRVSFTHIFQRGKISDLVNLLSGRNFETRENLESIAEDSFHKLREGVEAFVNETNFKRYLMIVQSTGIVDSSLVRSKNVLNFGYILYLSLKDRGMHPAMIESIVRRWIVLSMLTGRYSGSAESAIDYDIKRFTEQDPETFLKTTETGELSDAFWNTVLVQRLDTSVASSPYFLVFLMAQVKRNARGFLSKQITVQSLIEQRGDIHHIFPKKYLQKNGVDARKDYNQIANYAYTQSETNIKIKDDAPCEYMARMKQQVAGEGTFYGGITDMDDLRTNLAENCVPEAFMEMDIFDYQVFLDTRRTMMAQYIREYYEGLA